MADQPPAFPLFGSNSKSTATGTTSHRFETHDKEYEHVEYNTGTFHHEKGSVAQTNQDPDVIPLNQVAQLSPLLPEGKTPTSLYIKSQATLNVVYVQQYECTTRELTYGSPPLDRTLSHVSAGHGNHNRQNRNKDFHHIMSTTRNTHADTGRHDDAQYEHLRRQTPIQHRLGPRVIPDEWDTMTKDFYPTYQEAYNTSVYTNRMQGNHATYKPNARATYNSEAEDIYSLVYRPAGGCRTAKLRSKNCSGHDGKGKTLIQCWEVYGVVRPR
ncbi:hypothetical protein HanOQP8_Chr15g0564451 [Helianthus annuus]|nr:hypothetical protein HanHA89_Chr15g0605471 [Helianthus annuus]KAJ0647896.1 hypothetical protein HanLR1_Chr15g0566801 [Helianthus annuus]KAJ0651754.1 hypothetical protein HanOQP8_Chr15g0564451 [Helianthus annuus]